MIVAQLALAGDLRRARRVRLARARARSARAAAAPERAARSSACSRSAIAFFSATQDIALDAYTVEVLHKDEQGAAPRRCASSATASGCCSRARSRSPRASGSPLAARLPPRSGAVFAAFTLLVLAAPRAGPPRRAAALAPARRWSSRSAPSSRRPDAIAIALFLVFYKFGDNMGGTMVNPFLKDLCFSNAEAGAAIKTDRDGRDDRRDRIAARRSSRGSGSAARSGSSGSPRRARTSLYAAAALSRARSARRRAVRGAARHRRP